MSPRRFRQRPEAGRNDFWRSTIALDKRSAKSFIRINDRIRAREIRVIDENSEQLGIMAPFDALKIARERGLDLVEVSPNAVPPVCRITDYGKFKYELKKKDKEVKSKAKIVEIKESQVKIGTSDNDMRINFKILGQPTTNTPQHPVSF